MKISQYTFCLTNRQYYAIILIKFSDFLSPYTYYTLKSVHNQYMICTNFSICFALFFGGLMSIRYKIDILQALKERGITTYTIRKQNLLSQGTLTKLNQNDTSITLNNLETLCGLLNCQPSDLIEYAPDENRIDEQK